MNGYGFNEACRRVLERAHDDAHRRLHEYVGTEHLLSALLEEEDSIASDVLRALDIDPADVRKQLDLAVRNGNAGDSSKTLPYTSRARRVVELSMAEARELGHGYIGPEHLLGGLISEEQGIGAQVLIQSGATLDRVRRATVRELEKRGTPQAKVDSVVQSVTVEVRMNDGSVVRDEFESVPEAIRFLSRP